MEFSTVPCMTRSWESQKPLNIRVSKLKLWLLVKTPTTAEYVLNHGAGDNTSASSEICGSSMTADWLVL